MKLSVAPADLKEAVRFAQTAIAGRPTSPIMGGVLLEAKDGQLTASGSDYAKVARVAVPAQIEAEGTALLHASLLSQAAGKLKGKADVTISDDGTMATFVQGRAKFRLPMMPVTEYPQNLEGELVEVGRVSGEDFAKIVSTASISTVKADLEILACVRLEIGTEITAMGTDRYRLSMDHTAYDRASETDYGLNINALWVKTVAKTIGGDTALLVALDGEKPVRFAIQSGDYSTSITVVDGDYPKIRGLFANRGPEAYTLDRQELIDALDLVGVMSERNTPARIKGQGETIRLESTGTEGESASDLGSDNEAPFLIGINPALALDVLRNIDSEHIRFVPAGPKPIYITPAEGTAEYLLMPVRLPGQ
ncbi:DNA polymerase III subunit beta [Glutamicibacter sp. X7]